LADEADENGYLQTADVTSQTIHINFNGTLGPSMVAGGPEFAIAVNGKPMGSAAGVVKMSEQTADLTLSLAPATIQPKDVVDVYWEGLSDAKGRSLSGQVSIVVH
jgi:hypothetical protein